MLRIVFRSPTRIIQKQESGMAWTPAGSTPQVAFAWMAFSPDADFDASHAGSVGKGDAASWVRLMVGAGASVRAIATGNSASNVLDKRWLAAASLMVLASVTLSAAPAGAQSTDQ